MVDEKTEKVINDVNKAFANFGRSLQDVAKQVVEVLERVVKSARFNELYLELLKVEYANTYFWQFRKRKHLRREMDEVINILINIEVDKFKIQNGVK